MKVTGDQTGGGSEAALVIEPQAGVSEVVLPEAAYLAEADFSRLGSDLLLQAQAKPSVLIRGYFDGDEPPALLSPEGARFGPELTAKLAGPLAPGQVVQSGTAAGSEAIGEVTELTGTARVTRTNGAEEQLSLGDSVFLGDVVATGPESSLGIKFVDDTLFSLGAEARLVLNTLIFDPGGDANTLAVSIVSGAFALISGQIAGSDGPGITVETPVATIGVRGTALTGIYEALTHILTTTLLEFAGTVGAYEVFNAVSVQSLINALDTVEVSSQTQSIDAPSTATPAQLALYTFALGAATRAYINLLQNQEPEAGDEEQDQGQAGDGINDSGIDFAQEVDLIGQFFGAADDGTFAFDFSGAITLLELFDADSNLLLLLLGLILPEAANIAVGLSQGLENEEGAGGGLEASQIGVDLDIAPVGAGESLSISILNVPPQVTLVADNGFFFFNDTEEAALVSLTQLDLEGLAVIPPEFSDSDFTLFFEVIVSGPGGEAVTFAAVLVNVQAVADFVELLYTALEADPEPLAVLAAVEEVQNRIQIEREGQGRIGLNETFDEPERGGAAQFLNAEDLGEIDGTAGGRALTVDGWAGTDPEDTPEDGVAPRPDVDVYKVTLTTAGTYIFDIDFASLDETGEPDAKGRIDGFDALLAIYDANGNRLALSDPAAEGEDPFLELGLAAGMYFVVVTPSSNQPKSTFAEGFESTAEEEDDVVGDYRLQIRGDEGPILPGARFEQIEVEDNAFESPEGSGMYMDAADLIKHTGFKFRVGEQIEDGGDVTVGPDGSESITRIEITVRASNAGESFEDIPGFMLDFGGGSGFIPPDSGSVDIRARLFGKSEFETVQAGLSFRADLGLYVLTFPETLRVQEVDLMQLDWKVERHDDHDFDLQVIVRSTETHPQEPIGVVAGVFGSPKVTRIGTNGEFEETLETNDPIFLLDDLSTAAGETLFVLLSDGTIFELTDGDELFLDTSVFDPMLGADTEGFKGDPGQVATPHTYQSATLSVQTKAIADKPLVSLTSVCVTEDVGEAFIAEGAHGQQDGSEGPLTVTSTLNAETVDRDGTESLFKIVLSVSDVDLFDPALALADFKLFIDGEEIDFALLIGGGMQEISLDNATVFRGGGEVGPETVTGKVTLVGTTLEITFPDNDEAGEESVLGLTADIDLTYPRHEAEDFTLHAEVTTAEINAFGEVEVLTATQTAEPVTIEIKEVADQAIVDLTSVCVTEDVGEVFGASEHGEQTGSEGPLTVTSLLTARVQDEDGSEGVTEVRLSVSGVDLSDPALALSAFMLTIDGKMVDFGALPATLEDLNVTLFDGTPDDGGTAGLVDAAISLDSSDPASPVLVLEFLGNDDAGEVSILGLGAPDGGLPEGWAIDLKYPQHEAEDFDLTATVTTKEVNPDGTVARETATASKTANIEVKEVADQAIVGLTHVCVTEDVGALEHGEQDGSEGPLTVTSLLTARVQDEDGSEGVTEVRLSVSGVDLSDPALALSDFMLTIDGKMVDFGSLPATLEDLNVTLFDGTPGDGGTAGLVDAAISLDSSDPASPVLVLEFLGNDEAGEISILGLGAPDGGLPEGWAIDLKYPQHEAEDFTLKAEIEVTEVNPDGTVAVATSTTSTTADIEVKEVADQAIVALTDVCVIEDTGVVFGSETHLQQSGSEGDGDEGGPPLSVTSTLTARVQDTDGSEGLTVVRLSVADVDLGDPGLALSDFSLMIDGKAFDFGALPATLEDLNVTLFDGTPGDGGTAGLVDAAISLDSSNPASPVLVLEFLGNDEAGEVSILGLGAPDGGLPEGWDLKLTYPQHEAEDFTLKAEVTVTEINPDGTVAVAESLADATATIEVKEVADAPVVTLTSVCVVGDTGEGSASDQQDGSEGADPRLSVVSTLEADTQDRDGSESLSKIVVTIASVELALTDLEGAGYELMIDDQAIDIAALAGGPQDITLANVTLFGSAATTTTGRVTLVGETLEITFPDNDAEGDSSVLSVSTDLKLTYPQHEADDFTVDATVTVSELNPDGTVAVATATASAETATIEVKEVADAPEVTLTSVCVVEDTGEAFIGPGEHGEQDGSEGPLSVVSTLDTNTQDQDGSESLSKIVVTIASGSLAQTDLEAAGYTLMIDDQAIDIAALAGAPQDITLADVSIFGSAATTTTGRVTLVGETLEITFPDNDAEGDPSVLTVSTDIKLSYPQHEAEDFTVDATVTSKELNPDGTVGFLEATASAETATIEVKENADEPEVSLTSLCVLEDTGEVFGASEHGQQSGSEGPLSLVSTLSTNTQDQDGSESLTTIVVTIASSAIALTDLEGAGYTLMIDDQAIDITALAGGPQDITLADVSIFGSAATTATGRVSLVGETLEITFPNNDEAGDASILSVSADIKLSTPQHEAEDFTIDATVTVTELNPDGTVARPTATASASQASLEVKEVADAPDVTEPENLTYCEDNASAGEGGEFSDGSPVFALPLEASTVDRDGSEGISQIKLTLSGLAAGEFVDWTREGTVLTDGATTSTTIEGVDVDITVDGQMLTIDYADGDAPLDVILSQIELKLAQHYSGSFTVGYMVTSKEVDPDGATVAVSEAVTSDSYEVTVEGVADDPSLSANNVTVDEDQKVTLDITAALADLDGSESMVVTVTGIPTDWTLVGSNGSLVSGTWTSDPIGPSETQTSFVNPMFMPPDDFNTGTGSLNFGVSVEVTEGAPVKTGAETAGASTSFDVTISPVNDSVTVSDGDDTMVDEDGMVTLTGLSISDVDSDSVPDGEFEATIEATNGEVEVDGGTADTSVTVTGDIDEINALLAAIKYIPDADFSGDGSVTVTVTDEVGAVVHTGSGGATTDASTVDITVKAVADAPEVEIPGALVPSISLADPPTFFSEDFNTNTLGPNFSTIHGTPSTAAGNVSVGTAEYVGTNDTDYENGSFIAQISVIPTATTQAFFGFGRGSFLPDPGDNFGNPATGPVVFIRHFDPGGLTANPNNLTVTTNDENNAGLSPGSPPGMGEISNVSNVGPGNVPYTLQIEYDAGAGTVQFSVNNVPYGPGLVDVSSYDFTGQGRIFFGGTAVSFDDFSVQAVEDEGEPTPTLFYCEDNATAGEGGEFSDGDPIFALPIDASVTDTDGSEGISQIKLTLSDLAAGEFVAWTHNGSALTEGLTVGLTIDGVTVDVTVSGTMLTIDYDDGDAPLSASVSEIGVELAQHYSGTFTVDHMVTAKELGPGTIAVETATTSGSFDVTVEGVADEASLTATDVTVDEDEKVTLDIAASLVDLDGSETMVVTVTGIPTDWTHVDDTNGTFDDSTGTWTSDTIGSGDSFTNPMFMPPDNFNTGGGSLGLNVSVTTTEIDTTKIGAETAGTSQAFSITITPVNDPANISGDLSGSILKGIDSGTSGSLTISDDDEFEEEFDSNIESGTFGTFELDSNGDWTYTIDSTPTTTFTESFTVKAIDGTEETVEIFIEGGEGAGSADPIFFDLGDQGVSFVSVADGVAFDLDADGVAERIAWGAGEDGLLVADLDGSGAIEDGREVLSPDFGDGGFGDALDALLSLDDNADGSIDAQDAAYQVLRLWLDGNVDGVTQEGELVGLEEQGIVSIDLATTAVDLEADGQQVYAQGDYVLESGEARQFIAVNLDQVAGAGLGADETAEAPSIAASLPTILRNADQAAESETEVPDIADLAALRRAGQFVQRSDFVTGAYALVPLVNLGDLDWASMGIEGSIDRAGDIDVYAFLARAGETLRVDALSASAGAQIELRGPDGQLLAVDDGASGGDTVPADEDSAALRSLSATAPADGLTFVVVRESAAAGAEAAGSDYLLAMSVALDGDNDGEFAALGPGEAVQHVMIDADYYLALGAPIPLDLVLATEDQDGSERLYELEISGLHEGAALSYLDASGALVTVVDGSAEDGDGVLDGRVSLDLTQYEGSAFASGPEGRLTSLVTGKDGIDLKIDSTSIDESDMALMIRAVTQEVGATGVAEFAEELVTVDVVISGVGSILVDESGANALQGGAGGDLLLGGVGADQLWGGGGSDTFILRPGDGGAALGDADVIHDFEDGIDLIGLSDGLSVQDLSVTDSVLGAVVSSGSETLAVVTGTPAVDLTEEDFVVLPI